MPENPNKLLIVDDRKASRLVIEFILDSLDIEIYHASSGNEALKQVLRHDFAVILMDVVMPDLDGYETTRLIRNKKQYREIPIIMITANENSRENYIKAYEAGAVDYVSKPIEPIVLLTKVRQFVKMNSQRRDAENSEKEQAKISSRMQGLLNSAGEGILGIDLSGEITFANPNAGKLLQMGHQKLIGRSIQGFLYEATNDDDLKGIRSGSRGDSGSVINLLRRDESYINNERWMTGDGVAFFVEYSCEAIRDSEGKEDGAVVTFQNVTDRKAIEDKLLRLANYDPLTNLANRAYFHDSLVREIARTKRSNGKLALLFLDLDNFKDINDSLGHDAGDSLLQVIGNRLSSGIRAGDIAARIGGDEFAIILNDISSINDIVSVADKIIKKVQEPVEVTGNSITISTSIGIALYNDLEMSLTDLVKAADIAMYAAKTEGRNNYQFFEIEMQRKAAERNKIQTTLSLAIKNNELTVHFQPKVSIELDKVVGLEALIRWTTNDGNSISPGLFIPIAEDSGLIHALGEYVLRQVCRQISEWIDLPGFEDIVVSVNVSALQLKAGNFHLLVESVLDEFGIEAKHLELELTETAVMTDPTMAAKELHFIHELGVGISIDDFGTGYSSLNYLKRFPIDILKIDQCFVSDIGHDYHDEEIIKIVVAIAHTMGIQVIAEGVETKEQLGFLASIGCDLVQGWYFSKALDADAATHMIHNINTTYSECFEEFHTYMNDNNITPMIGKMIH